MFTAMQMLHFPFVWFAGPHRTKGISDTPPGPSEICRLLSAVLSKTLGTPDIPLHMTLSHISVPLT